MTSNLMGTRSPEGGNPFNIDLSSLTPVPEKRELGWSLKKLEEPKQQPIDPELEAYRQVQKIPRGSTVFVGPLRVPRPLPKKP
jgi:hypothetical protein